MAEWYVYKLNDGDGDGACHVRRTWSASALCFRGALLDRLSKFASRLPGKTNLEVSSNSQDLPTYHRCCRHLKIKLVILCSILFSAYFVSSCISHPTAPLFTNPEFPKSYPQIPRQILQQTDLSKTNSTPAPAKKKKKPRHDSRLCYGCTGKSWCFGTVGVVEFIVAANRYYFLLNSLEGMSYMVI